MYKKKLLQTAKKPEREREKQREKDVNGRHFAQREREGEKGE